MLPRSHSRQDIDPASIQSDDNFDDSYESLLRLSARLGDVKPKDRGLSREKISSFNTFKYADWPSRSTDLRESIQAVASTSALPLSDGNSEKEEKCGICLTEYEVDDDILMSPCSHGFHSPCLSVSFSFTCHIQNLIHCCYTLAGLVQ